MKPTDRDLQAQRAIDALGLAPLPTADSVAELEPEMAVRVALAWHLARIEAHVEGSPQPLRPAYIGEEWAEGVQPSKLPSLVVLGRSARQGDATLGIPYRDADGRDVISTDERWGLWRVGEDVGDGMVHVFAAHAPQRDALANAVQDALSGNLDTLQSIGLALPEAALPPAFAGLFAPEAFPRARVALAGQATPVDDGLAAQGGTWRADVPFTWQAPRLAARARIPDLRSEVVVTVATPET